MKQIHDYILQTFHSNLPKSYQILCYDTTKMSFAELENQMHKRISLFSSSLHAGILNATNAPTIGGPGSQIEVWQFLLFKHV